MEKSNELVVTHTFDAPRDMVYKMWTDKEHLKNWWGPKGFSIDIAKFEFLPNGAFHYKLQSAEGHVMWGKFIYLEMAYPEKLVYISSFSDEQGQTVRAPFSETFPLQIKNTLLFSEIDGKTTLTFTGVPIDVSNEENEFFIGMQEAMKQGFAGTFDQLENYLVKVKL